MADFKPQDLSQLDKDRLSSYKSNLDFYGGSQWAKTSKNRQLVFNYSKIAVDKITSYLMNGLNYSFEPLANLVIESSNKIRAKPGNHVIASPDAIGAKQSFDNTPSPDLAKQAEAVGYSRKPGESLFTVRCVDAWGLLERYSFNRPAEWNAAASDFSVYDLIGKVIAAVGGTLTYKSRSSYITAIYPHLSVNAGENGAVVLRNLLALVPDVIFFVGLDGYIVYPQATDGPSYYLRFA